MNINYRETQYNFLETSAASSHDPRSPRVLSAQMMLSLENLVIFAIASIMVMIFCFSLGVERGKRFVSSDDKAAENVAVRAAVEPADVDADLDDEAASSTDAKKNFFSSLLAFKGSQGSADAKVEPAVAEKAVQKTPDVKVAKLAKTEAGQGASEKSAVATVVVKPAPPGAFTVQVASYKNEQSAQREVQNLKQKGYRDIYVLPKGSFVIVCVGNFSSKTDAASLTRKLNARYRDTLVRRL